jgi:hypothetical protein
VLTLPGADHIEKIIEFNFLDCGVYIDERITEYFAQLLAFGEPL